MSTAATEVRPSMIAGNGTFASADLAAGTAAVVYQQVPGGGDELGPVNHSCEPTLGWADELTLVALRDVAAGEELTVDYATCTDQPGFMLRCHCETYRCRQLIEGDDWRIPQLQRRYAGYWSPHLATRIAESPSLPG